MPDHTFLKTLIRFAHALWQRERYWPQTGWSNKDASEHVLKAQQCLHAWRMGQRDKDPLGHALVHVIAAMEGEGC